MGGDVGYFQAVVEDNSSKEQSREQSARERMVRKPPVPKAAKTVRQYDREFANSYKQDKPDFDANMITSLFPERAIKA